jgi:AccI restriction endonuclease
MKTSSFDETLSVPAEELEFELRGCLSVPWSDFLLNPRRLRGSDFLMRWSQGVWSEKRLIQAVELTDRFVAIPYGPSGTAPDKDPREVELYFERLDRASSDGMKRPDLLVLRKRDELAAERAIEEIGGLQELPFTHEDDPRMKILLAMSVVAIECENSLWRARQMPDYGAEFTSQRRLGGHPILKKAAVLPTIIIKEEDREKLRGWQTRRGIPIHVWHVFYDLAFGIAFDSIEDLIEKGLIMQTEQVFQAPGGATTRKTIYKIYYQYGYPLGETRDEPNLKADHITDKNGHILPYVRFEGGTFTLSAEALKVLDDLAKLQRQ